MKKQIARGAPPLLFLTLLLCGLLYTACRKPNPDPPITEEEKLPPATQEGKNTFGCLVDGKAWVPKWYFAPSGLQVNYNEITSMFSLLARKDLMYISLYDESDKVDSVGVYSVDEPELAIFDTSSVCGQSGTKEYYFTTGIYEITKKLF